MKAFALALSYSDLIKAEDDVEKKRLRTMFSNMQRPGGSIRKVEAIMSRSGIKKVKDYTIEDLMKLQDAYPSYQVLCYDQG